MHFEKLEAFLNEMPRRGLPACSLLVTHKGKLVYSHSAGFSDVEKTKPANENDLYWAFSITKITTCVAAMQLVEQGRLRLDDPVSKYLPAFSELFVCDKNTGEISPAKTTLTIEHLFTMTGGYGYYKKNEPECLTRAFANKETTTQELINALAQVPLAFEPGSAYQYSMCHDILAAVVEVISGERFADYVKAHILDPLGMQNTGFHLPEDEVEQLLSATYRYIPGVSKSTPIPSENKYNLQPNLDSGGGGLYTSPADQIKLMTALALGGTAPNGAQILRPETVAMMGENRLNDKVLSTFMSTRLYGYGWGLCGRAHIDPVVSGARSSVGEFGWDGAAGSFALIDPKQELALFFGVHIRGCQYVYHFIHPRLRDMTYDALEL